MSTTADRTPVADASTSGASSEAVVGADVGTVGDRERAAAAIEAALADSGATYERPTADHFVVSLPGTRKLNTSCSLLLGDHTLSVNAFVVRAVEESREDVYRWLLERNARLSGIAFALDLLGDVYLVGRVPLASVTATEIDRLLGSVLDASDSSFNQLLELGFAGSIRREWAWRLKRGEPTANLAAFGRLRPDADTHTDTASGTGTGTGTGAGAGVGADAEASEQQP